MHVRLAAELPPLLFSHQLYWHFRIFDPWGTSGEAPIFDGLVLEIPRHGLAPVFVSLCACVCGGGAVRNGLQTYACCRRAPCQARASPVLLLGCTRFQGIATQGMCKAVRLALFDPSARCVHLMESWLASGIQPRVRAFSAWV